MALVKWEPVRELHSLQHEMNRLFGNFFDAPTGAGNGGGVRQWIPAMDLVETKDHFILRADLPGLTEKDVTVELEENVLSVSGERRPETTEEREGYYRIERARTVCAVVDAAGRRRPNRHQGRVPRRRARGARAEASRAQAATRRDRRLAGRRLCGRLGQGAW
jgi:HSP20 family molecular chaperone IbpA